eukprot:scaffold287131_cov18-Tisochrysis_lutea.AAC.1
MPDRIDADNEHFFLMAAFNLGRVLHRSAMRVDQHTSDRLGSHWHALPSSPRRALLRLTCQSAAVWLHAAWRLDKVEVSVGSYA